MLRSQYIIVIKSTVEPAVGLESKVEHRRIVDGRVVDAPAVAEDAVHPLVVKYRL